MVQLGRSWLFASGALLSCGISADARTITGTCVLLMDGGFRLCEKLASDFSVLGDCCAAVGEMNKLGCFTLPAVAEPLAKDENWKMGKQMFATMCAAQIGEEQWLKPFEPTYNMGCPNLSDEQVDGLRTTFMNEYNYWADMGLFGDGDDYETYRASMDGLMSIFTKPDGSQVTLTSFGLGTFKDTASTVEYNALGFPYAFKHAPINSRFWKYAGATRKTHKLLYGCNSLVAEQLTDATTDPTDPYEYWTSYRIDFEPCSATPDHMYAWLPEKALEEFIEGHTANDTVATKYCEEVMTRCTGGNQVYTSQQDCLDYYNSLPPKAEGCNFQTMGNSKVCRLKHHYLMFERPELHCFHVSKGLPDATGKIKCMQDECEASNDIDKIKEFSIGKKASPPFVGKYGGVSQEPPKDETWGVEQCTLAPAPPKPPAAGQCVEITRAMKQAIEAKGLEPKICK